MVEELRRGEEDPHRVRLQHRTVIHAHSGTTRVSPPMTTLPLPIATPEPYAPGSRLFASVPVCFPGSGVVRYFSSLPDRSRALPQHPWSQLGSIFTVLGAANLSLAPPPPPPSSAGFSGRPGACALKCSTARGYTGFGSVLYAIIYTPVILSPVVSGLRLLFFWGCKGMISTYLYQRESPSPSPPTW